MIITHKGKGLITKITTGDCLEFGVDYVGDDLTLVTNVTSYVKCQKLCQVKDLNKMSMLILLKVLRQIKLKK